MKTIRQLHFYLGTFFAPAIFFFAFSGALQTFSLHESNDDGSYTAPAWIMTIASIHKDQKLPGPPHKHVHPAPQAEQPAGAAPAAAHDEDEAEPHSSLLLKCFVLLLAIGLMTSAALGIYMALQSRNNRKVTWGMLAAGIVVPVVMFML
jgi:hypothetical protein